MKKDKEMKVQCNHVTRDIRPSDCPACNIKLIKNKVQELGRENQIMKKALEEIVNMEPFTFDAEYKMICIALKALGREE